jgi:hypothetical protein
MSLKTRDTRTRARLLAHAFTETLVGIFALRIPQVQHAVKTTAPQMTVISSYEGQHCILDAHRIVSEIYTSGPEIITTINQVTAVYVAAMWDLLTTHAHYDVIAHEPDIQFFRHLRNACGHDGKWNFKQLKQPAIWRDKELKLEHIGQEAFGGLLKHGDVLLLFIDVDMKYFEQKTQ